MHLDDEGTINPKYAELQDIAQGVLKGAAKALTSPDHLMTRSTPPKGPFNRHCVRMEPLPGPAHGAQRQGVHPAGHW